MRAIDRWIRCGVGPRSLLAGGFATLLLLAGNAMVRAEERSGASGPEPVQPLEVVHRFHLETGEAPPAHDLRWAGPKSVYLLYPLGGVLEHRLEEGLPIEKKVLPAFDDDKGIRPFQSLALWNGRPVAASRVHTVVWSLDEPDSSGYNAEILSDFGGNVNDVEVCGDTLFLLGYPPHPKEVETQWDVPLWTGSFDQELDSLEPLYRVPDAAKGSPRRVALSFSLYARAGAIRCFPNGDLLVFVGDSSKLLRVSDTGKVKKIWDLGELGVFDGADAASGDDTAEIEARRRQWLANGTIVEDVLVLGPSTPALIVRRPTARGFRSQLVVVDPDRVETYSIPVARSDSRSRLVADVSESGDLAVLVADRGDLLGGPFEDQELLVLRIP